VSEGTDLDDHLGIAGVGVSSLSLCSGIGGLDLGLHLALPHLRTVGYVAREAFAARILLARMEDKTLEPAPVYCGDLERLSGEEVMVALVHRPDIITAGFPCQDISLAGSGRGLAGTKSGVWFEVLRLIRVLEPRVVFLENVPALTSRGLNTVLGGLAEAGFDAEWGCFRAEDAHAPHRRERIFILAWHLPDALGHPLRIIAERGKSLTLAPERWDRESRDMGEAVADTQRDGLEGLESAGAAPRSTVGGSGTELGHTDGRGLRELGLEEHTRQQGEGGDQFDRSGEDWGFVWPPKPNDAEGWRLWISTYGPEPAVRRGTDGLASRVDSLRACGNGVVPVVAGIAFETLAKRALQ